MRSSSSAWRPPRRSGSRSTRSWRPRWPARRRSASMGAPLKRRSRGAGDSAEHGQHRAHVRMRGRAAAPRGADGVSADGKAACPCGLRLLGRGGCCALGLASKRFWRRTAPRSCTCSPARRSGSLADASYGEGAFLLFGRESRGLPLGLIEALAPRCVRIPMRTGLRSLNLSNAVAVGRLRGVAPAGLAGAFVRRRRPAPAEAARASGARRSRPGIRCLPELPECLRVAGAARARGRLEGRLGRSRARFAV